MLNDISKILTEVKATDEDSVSSDPVAPVGGKVKPRRGDLMKKVNPEMDDIERDVKTPQGTLKVGMGEEFDNLFDGLDLSEEFKSKAVTVIESFLAEKERELSEELTDQLNSVFEVKIEDAITELTDSINDYLDYVVEEWQRENELQIESAIKVDVAESLINSLKNTLAEHNIVVDETESTKFDELTHELEEQKKEITSLFNSLYEEKEKNKTLEEAIVFSAVTENLTDTQAARLERLMEGVHHSNIKDYRRKLEELKEHYFPIDTATSKRGSDLMEEFEYVSEQTMNSSISAYAEALAKFNPKK